MKGFFLCFLLLSFPNTACQESPRESQISYPENVGDISFDKDLDDPNFKVCNEHNAFQYYTIPTGFPFKGEKIRLIEFFRNAFEAKRFGEESGYVTIRFIVNCEGATGRFRVQEMDSEYRQTQPNKDLVGKLLQTTKKLNGWIVASNGTTNFDYYQYLTFKIENGKLTEILP